MSPPSPPGFTPMRTCSYLVVRTSRVLLLCYNTFSAADELSVRMVRNGSRLVLGAYTRSVDLVLHYYCLHF